MLGGTIVNFVSLAELPKPVEEYFRNVLVDGQKLINLARFQQVGELKVDSKSKNCLQFEASYFVSKSPAAFIWDAKINIAPALHVRVRDSLLGGDHFAGFADEKNSRKASGRFKLRMALMKLS